MIRDRGPLHNIGNGVTSRDIPLNEGETEGISQDSGAVARALNGHPVMRFFAHAGTTMLVAGVGAAMLRKGGLKLTQKLQESGNTSLIKDMIDVRKHLDNLQGVKRAIDGVNDPYEKLVFEIDDELTTGYLGSKHSVYENYGYSFTKGELDQAGRGLTSEPAAIWGLKEDIQQRIIRVGRRMPYELPALWGAQRMVTDPLFGKDGEKKKINWYNPADVVSDFVKTSVSTMATMILPFEAGGAALNASKSSLNTFKYSMTSIADLSPIKQKAAKGFLDLNELLGEVGHDLATAGNAFLKKTAQSSGALNAATTAMGANEQPRILDALHKARKGARAAYEASRDSRDPGMKRATSYAKALAFGVKGLDGEIGPGLIDTIPALRGLNAGVRAGAQQFRVYGEAYDALQNSIQQARVLSSSTPRSADIISAMQKIQAQYSSRLSKFANQISVLGAGGPDDAAFTRSDFYLGQQQKEYKELLQKRLVSRGLDEKETKDLVSQMRVVMPGAQTHPTNMISIGKMKIHADEDEYFDVLLQRLKNVKGGKDYETTLANLAGPGKTSDEFLKEVIEETNTYFTSKEFQHGVKLKIKNQWNSFYRNDLSDIGSSILKPEKAVYQDFVGPLNSAKKQFLQRKTAQVLGIPLKDTEGRMVSEDIIRNGLSNRGFDPNDFTNLKSFLIRNKKITSGIFEGNFNLFGMKPLLISEAIDRGKFAHLPGREQQIIKNLAGRMAVDDPVSKSIGFNKLEGVYQSKSGQILDFSSIKTSFKNVANFLASDLHIPIIKLNPADLFGYRSFAEIAQKGPIQYSPGFTVQPFGEVGRTRADFHIWHATKGTKGKVTSYSTNEFSGQTYGTTLSGTYRPLPTRSSEMLTKHARFASGLSGESAFDIDGKSGSRFLDFVLGNSNRARGFKNAMDIEADQPNSLFGLLSRFRKRSYDINNPSVISKLLSGEQVLINESGVKKAVTLNKVGDKYNLVDADGAISGVFNESEILKSSDIFRKRTFGYGFTDKTMRELEEAAPEIFTRTGLTRVSEIRTPQQAREAAAQLESMKPVLSAKAREAGIDTRFLEESYSRIRNIVRESDLLAASQSSSKSSTITTRLDELKNEIFRYVSQANAVIGQGGSSTESMFINIQNVLTNLKKSLPASKYAEAQAAALSTLFNISAYTTYNQALSSEQNARAALDALLSLTRSTSAGGTAARSFLEPFTRGTESLINTGVKRPFNAFLPSLRRKFGTASFKPSEYSVDPLGSGQGITFVPTFGTVFDKNPFGAIKSALGIGTYKNPQDYSTASTAVSQGVERLNRYFGTLGMQLDVSKFNGPLDLYMRGMVGKRVLPIFAAGTTAFTIDRTIGGYTQPKDQNGERVYSPFFTTKAAAGVVEARSILSGITPGGPSYEDKKDQLTEGLVPIRQGRFWPLGNTPFKGGKVQYYRPSWYRKLQAGAMFTSDTYGSPMEKFLYYNDISPLRPFDPYRFENKHYYDRPYPVTGEYFTGPFGPAVPLLNATLGKILKPQVLMHQQELNQGLQNYVPAGEFGAYNATPYLSAPGGAGVGGGRGVSGLAVSGVARTNQQYQSAGSTPLYTAGNATRQTIAGLNQPLMQMAYGPTKQRGIMPAQMVPTGAPLSPGSIRMQAGSLGYTTQEMAGIYGFGFSSLREKFGFGQSDFQPDRATLQSASKAYGVTRAFWDLNLGGAGDIPLPAQGALGNLEFSEIVRRFIPKERSGVDYLNPIQNTMGQQYPFLPGAEYFTDFTRGDPFTKVAEGELRLPGKGYERLNVLNSDATGRYGLVDQLSILADVAPYSNQFKKLNNSIDSKNLSPDQRIKVQEIRERVAQTTKKYEFSRYEYKDKTAAELGISDRRYKFERTKEYLAHRDTIFNTKFWQNRTAQEDWERRNVYGSTFPQWQRPFESFIKPMVQKATQRDPITAAGSLLAIGTAFGRTPKGKAFGGFVGAATGLVASTFENARERLTGERFIPKTRKKELALEEYTDILNYVKYSRLSSMAQQSGNAFEANQYRQAAKRTMYGADIYGAPVETLSLAIPKRKREHFLEMINAPESERKAILSTSGRLERRIYEAAWGMPVEDKPDLAEYFSRHELPDLNWEGWHPNTNLDHVKVKIGQSMGLEMSQMGYYPQQIKEANLANPSFPEFRKKENKEDTLNKLRNLLRGSGVSGTITPVANTFGSSSIDIFAGVR